MKDRDENVNDSLAFEIFKELKAQSKRWCIAFFTILLLWFATVGAFVWYFYQYDYVSYTQSGGGYNNINTGEQGDVVNGAEAKNP